MDDVRSIDGRGPAVDADAKRKWVEGWAKTMVDIWHDRIAKVHAIDTYNLFNSVSEVELVESDSPKIQLRARSADSWCERWCASRSPGSRPPTMPR